MPDAVDDHVLVRLAVRGVAESSVSRATRLVTASATAQAAELHARARRELAGIVAGNAAQHLDGARGVAARERDLGFEPQLLARVRRRTGGAASILIAFSAAAASAPRSHSPAAASQSEFCVRRRRRARRLRSFRAAAVCSPWRDRRAARSAAASAPPSEGSPAIWQAASAGGEQAAAARRSWRYGHSLASAAALGEDHPTAAAVGSTSAGARRARAHRLYGRPGVLYVVATPIGNLGDISARAREILAGVSAVAAEDTRHSGQLLRELGLERPLVSLHEHNERARIAELVARLRAGESIALCQRRRHAARQRSGLPAGARGARGRHRRLAGAGPCAAIAALSASGLPGERFCFEGFLPARAAARRRRLAELARKRARS